MSKPPARKTPARKRPDAETSGATAMVSSRPPQGHPDYEFPKEVHNLLVAAQTGHVSLSAMADTKASILMGATFLVFGVVVSQALEEKTRLSASMLVLAGFSLLATIFSVLAVRPKMPKPPSVRQPTTNLVFFGSFAGIPEEQYIDHVIDVLRSEEETYRVMARDLYQNGRVLYAKKYRYLEYAYNTFLIGLAVTFVVFLSELLTRTPQAA